MNFFSFSNKMR